MSNETVVTLFKGGTGEYNAPVKDLLIPDLWHAVQAIRCCDSLMYRDNVADNVLKVWHLCHDFRRHIQES